MQERLKKVQLRRKSPLAGTQFITDAIAIQRLLERAKRYRTRALFQLRGTDQRLEMTVAEDCPKSSALFLHWPPRRGKDLHDQLAQLHSQKSGLILLFLKGHQLVGMTAPLQQISEQGIVFGFPERVFRIQRRKHERCAIPGGYEITAEIQARGKSERRHRLRISDISANGISLEAPAHLRKELEEGDLLRPITFVLQGRRIVAEGLIQRISEAPVSRRGPFLIVGIKFTRISISDVSHIWDYVLYQNAQFASLYETG